MTKYAYESAGDFIDKLHEVGVELKTSEDGFDGSDYDTILTDDPFIVPAKKVKMFRDSEHYFTCSIILKNGNMLHVSAPINKISMSTKG